MITITPTPQQYNVTAPTMLPNLSVPPPNHRFPPPQRFHGPRHTFFQPFRPYGRGIPPLDPEFDGKRLRKSAMRKTVDYNSAIIKMIENRVWQRDFRDRRALQPDTTYIPDILPPPSYEENAINAVTTRFVKTATNKMRCPVFCMAWTPEGRRLVTGASSGEFTLWNGLTFNFETILQAHESPVRTMVWSHNDVWMVTADHTGYVKYWQSNMNSVKVFLAHKEAIRGISFSPNDSKFATCSDDGTVRIWDFLRCHEERILRGHGADVKCVHWHPQKGLVVSGSKDNQQPVKLWDPKTGQSLATLHAHKSTVMDVKWNKNGNWLVTASRDHLLKLFDIRNLSTEVQTFRGHKKESSSVAWHPYHEGLFCSGGSDGAILFWHVGADKEVGAIEQAHDSIVWTLAWHPLGHVLCSGSNDHTSKFWTRNRPGDQMRDKYNLNTLPASIAGLDENDIDDISSVIPGMGPEDKVDINAQQEEMVTITPGTIPGLDIDSSEDKNKTISKKVPYSKPIPKNFQAQWNETGKDDSTEDSKDAIDPIAFINSLIEKQPGVIPLSEVEPEAIFIYGKLLNVESNTPLAEAIAGGSEKLFKYVNSGAVPELRDVMPYLDVSDNEIEYQMSEDETSDFNDGYRNNEMYGNDKQDWQDNEDPDMRFQGMPSMNRPLAGYPGQADGPQGSFPMQGPSSMFGLQQGQNQDAGFGSGSQFNQEMFRPMNQPQNMSDMPSSLMKNTDGGSDNYPPSLLQGNFRFNMGSNTRIDSDMGSRQGIQHPPMIPLNDDSNHRRPPPLIPNEDIKRFRSDFRNDRPSPNKGRGRGSFGSGDRFNNRSRFDNSRSNDGDRDDGDEEEMYGNGEFHNRGRERIRRWDDNDGIGNNSWDRRDDMGEEEEDEDEEEEEEGEIDDRDEERDGKRSQGFGGSGFGGRGRGMGGKFGHGTRRGGKKGRGFDRPWRGSRGRGGGKRGVGGGGGRGKGKHNERRRGGRGGGAGAGGPSGMGRI